MAEAEASGSGPGQSSGDTSVVSVTDALQAPSSGDAVGHTPCAAVKEAIANFTPAPGRQLVTNPKRHKSKSALYEWGVITEKIPTGDEIVQRKQGAIYERKFHCLANSRCRATGRELAIKSNSTTGGMNHLKAFHGLTHAGSAAAKKAKIRYDLQKNSQDFAHPFPRRTM